MWSTLSGVSSRQDIWDAAMSPTLLTSTSIAPEVPDDLLRDARARRSQTAMSPWTVIASPPSSRTSAAVSSAPALELR